MIDEIKVTSAWYPVKEFTMNLYNLLVELDPEVAVENRYEDETYDPVGGILVYKNQLFMDEDTLIWNSLMKTIWKMKKNMKTL